MMVRGVTDSRESYAYVCWREEYEVALIEDVVCVATGPSYDLGHARRQILMPKY